MYLFNAKLCRNYIFMFLCETSPTETGINYIRISSNLSELGAADYVDADNFRRILENTYVLYCFLDTIMKNCIISHIFDGKRSLKYYIMSLDV